MNLDIIIPSIITGITVLVTGILLHKREVSKHKLEVEKYRGELKQRQKEIAQKQSELEANKKEIEQDKIKLDFFNRAMDLSRINPIIDGVDRIFEATVADRFLILIAINGKTDFNIVSVIFEQHRPNGHKVNAIGTYRNIHIDDDYRKMLKASETLGVVNIDVAAMKDCLLKQFYQIEGVTYSKVRFLGREKIDESNDFLIYSSLATHGNKPFSNRGKAIAKTVYEGTIIPNIKKIVR